MASGAPQVWSSFVAGNVAVASASEAVIGTLVIGSVSEKGQQVRLVCSAQAAIDTSATSVVFKLKPDSISGTALATVTFTPKAANNETTIVMPIEATDTLGDVVGKTYVLTSTAASAAAGYNASSVSMVAIVGPG